MTLFRYLKYQIGIMTPTQMKSLRKKLGLSQHGMSRLMGHSQPAICRWENGTAPMPPFVKAHLIAMAKAYAAKDKVVR